MLCCVFVFCLCFVCLRPVFCDQCCQCLWIAHSWVLPRFSLTFIHINHLKITTFYYLKYGKWFKYKIYGMDPDKIKSLTLSFPYVYYHSFKLAGAIIIIIKYFLLSNVLLFVWRYLCVHYLMLHRLGFLKKIEKHIDDSHIGACYLIDK